ncbi:MAG: Mur ligase [Gammaproteobacteria bacterium]|nr:Mur ligase [Gammaproteobacteria bacterium]
MSDKLDVIDSRRLTGPNLLWDKPGAVIDVKILDASVDDVIRLWNEQLKRMLTAVDWNTETTTHRINPDFTSLAFSAPIDALYAATEINEWVIESVKNILAGKSELDLEPEAGRLKKAIAEEVNPKLLALRDAAAAHGITFLSDDDDASVGLGKGSLTWPVTALPAPGDIDWQSAHDIPLGLITGTNGKTTTVRMACAIAQQAGLTVGLSSTDWIAVGEEILDKGDYSGPGGARTVLRDKRVDVGILEAARGGLIRRGLAVEHADAALITNIAEDHMGESGIHDLNALLDVKWIITRALNREGVLVLNADDPMLVSRAPQSPAPVCFYSIHDDNETVVRHMKNGGKAVFVEHGHITFFDGRARTKLIPIKDIPLALGGAAKHNVSNALGAAALSLALGITWDAVVLGLKLTQTDANPGRGNLYEINGAKFLVDFAHNPHGLEAIFSTAAGLRANRKLILLGQAGDRSDDAIRDLTRKAWEIQPDFVIIKEMGEYSRGRPQGEVPGIIKDELIKLGATPEQYTYVEKEIDAAKFAIDWAAAGDLALLLVHGEKEAVIGHFSAITANN